MSERPPVLIGYPDGPQEEDVFWYEGTLHPAPCNLPLTVADCAGVRFEMDGITFELAGDLGGHAVYRSVEGDDSLYTMTWEDLSSRWVDGTIEFDL